MDGSKTYNIPPETAYPPPSYTENTLNPNTGYDPNQGVHGSLPQYGVQNPQGAQTVVTTLSTVYVTQVPLNPHVPDYLGYSIFTMLCCCLPLGIAGLIFSISTRDANNRGQRELAEKTSCTAWILNSIGLAIGIAATIALIAIFIVYRYVTELLGGEAYVSCSVVLPAFCHLHHVMRVSDEDPAYVTRFKTAFSKDLAERQADMNGEWLKLASALDPRFKDLKCLSRGEREQVWSSLEKILEEGGLSTNTPQPCGKHEPAKKKRILLLGSDSDSEEENHHSNALHHYRAEPSIAMDQCPLEWWSAHAGAHATLSSLARKYLATPATTVPCERLFSLAGTVVQNKRASLNSENVNKLVCLSNWLKEK